MKIVINFFQKVGSYDLLLGNPRKRKLKAARKGSHKYFGNQVNILAARVWFRHLALDEL